MQSTGTRELGVGELHYSSRRHVLGTGGVLPPASQMDRLFNGNDELVCELADFQISRMPTSTARGTCTLVGPENLHTSDLERETAFVEHGKQTYAVLIHRTHLRADGLAEAEGDLLP